MKKTLFLLAFVGLAVSEEIFLPHLSRLDEIDIKIDFSYNLTCAACIRGGYFFCDAK